jgi:LemA protein
MKRSTIILIVVVLFLGIAGMNGCSSYNNMVGMEETVNGAWSEVENQYQRRLDLIPNIVATVQAEAEFEKGTLEAVINARASATKVTMNVDQLTPENIQKYQEAQQAVSSALARLLVVAESYPTLQTNASFKNLQVDLEGTENRIATARMRFNESVQTYNTSIRKFPRKIWAGLFDFDQKGYFESDEGADKAPDVNELFDK